MLHLSLLTLSRSSLRWQIMNSYQLHQLLWRAFPHIPRRSMEQRFLYRHEESDQSHSILVQSVAKPDWSFTEQAEGAAVQVRAFDPSGMPSGQRLRFFLRANPVTKRRGYSDGKNRHILIGSDRTRMAERRGIPIEELASREAQLAEWLRNKGAAAGFIPEQCVAGESRTYTIARPRHKAVATPSEKDILVESPPMTFVGVDFEGIIRVTDQKQFVQTLSCGIGRGKAFGFGLLSVAKLL